MKRQYFKGHCFKYFFKNPKFKTIVFIHGLGLNQDVWSWQVSLFKNHNVLIYDLLGHGDSKDPEGEISLSLFAEQLLQIINHIKIEKFIYGKKMQHAPFELNIVQHSALFAVIGVLTHRIPFLYCSF